MVSPTKVNALTPQSPMLPTLLCRYLLPGMQALCIEPRLLHPARPDFGEGPVSLRSALASYNSSRFPPESSTCNANKYVKNNQISNDLQRHPRTRKSQRKLESDRASSSCAEGKLSLIYQEIQHSASKLVSRSGINCCDMGPNEKKYLRIREDAIAIHGLRHTCIKCTWEFPKIGIPI